MGVKAKDSSFYDFFVNEEMRELVQETARFAFWKAAFNYWFCGKC